MRRNVGLLALVAMVVWATSAEARLPNTMNFDNLTGSNVNQTVAETSSNEKEVDFGDMDHDGDLDVVVGVGFSDFGARRNKLYRNDNGVFNEISTSSLVPTDFNLPHTTRNAFFRDLDNDGWVDIWITNDSNPGNGDRRDRIYMNLGGGEGNDWDGYGNDSGASRIPPIANQGAGMTGPECSSVIADFNDDGLMDFYGGNYPNSSQDHMYLNQPGNPGFFTAVTNTHVPSDSAYTIDNATADLNGDGTIDVLVGNWNASYAYYNDLLGNGDNGVGDFRYGSGGNGGRQFIVSLSTSNNEGAMEPADFDNDGDQDIYVSNHSGLGDRILRNDGNNGAGMVNWTVLNILPTTLNQNSRKCTIADLNNDGRLDAIVMRLDLRPVILRNTTVNGVMSFVDWTPGDAFPSGGTHRGWHSFAGNLNDDKYPDIFLGGWVNDHYFENALSNEMDEDTLDGDLPALSNQDPAAIMGRTHGLNADVYNLPGPGLAQLSVVLNSASDMRLIANGSSVNRGSYGIEEAVQTTTVGGGTEIQVVPLAIAGDSDEDGDIDSFDWDDFNDCIDVGGPIASGCEVFNMNGDDHIDFQDVQSLQQNTLGSGVPAPAPYVLEVLVRSNS